MLSPLCASSFLLFQSYSSFSSLDRLTVPFASRSLSDPLPSNHTFTISRAIRFHNHCLQACFLLFALQQSLSPHVYSDGAPGSRCGNTSPLRYKKAKLIRKGAVFPLPLDGHGVDHGGSIRTGLQNTRIVISDLEAPVFKSEAFVVLPQCNRILIRSLRETGRSSRSADSDAPREGNGASDRAWEIRWRGRCWYLRNGARLDTEMMITRETWISMHDAYSHHTAEVNSIIPAYLANGGVGTA